MSPFFGLKNMKQIPENAKRELEQLVRSNGLKYTTEWLEECLSMHVKDLLTCIGVQETGQEQGIVKTLTTILEKVSDTR